MHTRLWRVYVLICPITERIRYVGITSCSLTERLGYHVQDRSNPEKAEWIHELQQKGLAPHIFLIDRFTGTRTYAENIERHYIWFYLLAGCQLLNKQYIPDDIDAFLECLRASIYNKQFLNHVIAASTSA
jgi:hypothetical protein